MLLFPVLELGNWGLLGEGWVYVSSSRARALSWVLLVQEPSPPLQSAAELGQEHPWAPCSGAALAQLGGGLRGGKDLGWGARAASVPVSDGSWGCGRRGE